jgi:hypothetical protein
LAAALTPIVLFVEMLKFSKKINSKNRIFKRKVKNLLEYILWNIVVCDMETSKLTY